MNRTVKIGKCEVGDGHIVKFMAELGTFYNQDETMAAALVKSVIAAGPDIIKSEILHDADVVMDDPAVTVTYNFEGGSKTEKYHALIKRKCLPLPVYERIFQPVIQSGIPFVASVYDFEGVDF